MDSDSDFYGNEEAISALEARVDDFDIVAWWDAQNDMASYFHNTTQPQNAPQIVAPLNNAYQGQPGAWQLSESIEHFLARLPPATTDWSPGLDWIWIANPYIPPGPSSALAQFREGGAERLKLLDNFAKMATVGAAKASGKPLNMLREDLAKERRETVEDLRELAVACNVVGGKWMLFPDPGYVNDVWAKVARATANNELGIAAKVATRVETGKARLICVYTRDFRDKDDVARVLNRMRELELIRPGGRQIYYKSDAWTELGIYGGNNWGIQASIYSSNEIFSYIKSVAPGRSSAP
ncbi:uncharacterized protein B0T15DRAFT_199242 [Chaetomium strumarium]|uniref:DUF1917-domain-containing protein n=1 Tax=Chaetomium strumarium TaxID=1170767 RepID=A0AAJ0GSV8_9PEZI|nr:hypothetical protein B0T15DRAFT_199242 [Chaetomium strumarium]